MRTIARSRLPAEIGQRFGGAPDSLVLVSVGANAILRLACGSRDAYLRLTPPRRPRAHLDAATAYLAHCFAAGAPVNEPLLSVSGALVEPFEADGQLWHATAVAAVPGLPVGNRCLDPAVYAAWGAAMAQLHDASEGFVPPATAVLHTVDDTLATIRERAPRAEEAVQQEAARIERWAAGRGRDRARFGVTHGDFNAGNVLWDGASIRIVDFDEPVLDWYASDVARPFNELRDRSSGQRADLLRALVGGYRSVRPLAAEEVEALSWLLRLKALDVYLWSRVAWDEPEALGGGPAGDAVLHRDRVLHPLELPVV